MCACACVCAHIMLDVYFSLHNVRVHSIEMSEKISSKMTGALLAMSLAYYYVMGEQVEKEIRRTDEILSTILSWSADDSYTNLNEDQRWGNDYTLG